MNNRLESLNLWLQRDLGITGYTLAPASEDASFRRYFRVCRGAEKFIVMDAPPEREDCRPYVDVARRLYACGVNVPEIMEQDLDKGFLLIGDLGEALYLDVLTCTNAGPLYSDATAALLKIQTLAVTDGLPPYDKQLLMGEMELFRDWLLIRHLGLPSDAGVMRLLDENFAMLCQLALQQPRVFVHRDYHSRNLLVSAANNPGIVDFQDAVLGPVTYDPVSLFKDCYIKWPRDRIRQWLQEYYQEAAHQLQIKAGVEQFTRWFDFMGVQRQLKAGGIFARLWHRDQKRGFLKDIPRTLSYITDLRDDYRELLPLINLIEDHVLPALAGQD